MRAKLFLVILLMCCADALAQHPVQAYSGNVQLTPQDGINRRAYVFAGFEMPLDHSMSVPNNWYFALSENVAAVYVTREPNLTELALYPQAQMTIAHSVDGLIRDKTFCAVGTDHFFEILGYEAFDALGNPEMSLRYSTDAMDLGIFPLEYGYHHTDAVLGSYTIGTQSGNFTGMIDVEADAFGSLGSSIDALQDNSNATRLRIIQDLDLTDADGNALGNAQIVAYHYYRIGQLYPALCNRITDISGGFLAAPIHLDQVEYANSISLQTTSFASNSVLISPNPVQNVLHISCAEKIESVRIFDHNARCVFDAVTDVLDLEDLSKGLYLLLVRTESGSSVQKILKK